MGIKDSFDEQMDNKNLTFANNGLKIKENSSLRNNYTCGKTVTQASCLETQVILVLS